MHGNTSDNPENVKMNGYKFRGSNSAIFICDTIMKEAIFKERNLE